MGKLKTKKGVAKRFKLTKNKKVKYQHEGKSHLATCKGEKRKRKLRRADTLEPGKFTAFIKSMLPYG
jgi:large subunit ribosomal protein L35